MPGDEAKNEQDHEAVDTEIVEVAEEAPVSEETAVAADLTPEEALLKSLEDAAKFRDQALRAEAEMQNMQRRTARDVENAHKYGLERFLQNLLPVVDSLEKAIEAADAAQVEAVEAVEDPMTEGVRLCYKLLLDVIAKENVEVIDPNGDPFDPNEHQAMSMVENPDMEPNSVFAVVQKGYKLNGRLVRPAMVMVSKAPVTSGSDG
jgi:molecular chaperone GrpE